mgnify:CR=1 FL=1
MQKTKIIMRTLLILILTTSLSIESFAQEVNEEIKKTFKNYFQTIEKKDNEKTLDFIYPKLFEHFPKERMLQAMNKMKEDTSTIITMGNPALKSISKTLELDGIKYVLMKYSFKMTMKIFSPKNETNNEEENFNIADFTYEMLKTKYGEKNVLYNREKSKLDITVNNEMYVIKNTEYKAWKFLEKKESMKPLLKKILPKKVLKKL